jgi:L-alanine-DL-glutamate epimerase-like enolase superfamily enzyme
MIMPKIKNIQTFPLAYPEPHYKGIERYITLARIESDDGAVGWGECISQFKEATLATRIVIEQGLAPLLIGESAVDVENCYQKMLSRIWWYGPEGIAAFAVSALDMALWDLTGKVLNQPVATLLGGQLHDHVSAMASFIFDMENLDWTLNEFSWCRDQGYYVLKAGWGMRPEAVFGQDRTKDLEVVRLVRDVIGIDRDLVVDMPGARNIWDVPTAIRRFRDLEPYQLKWIEQPLLPSDLRAHARLRAAVSTPIGTGEDEWNVETYRALIESGGVDVIQIDPGRAHGITGSRQVIRLIEAANLKWSAHTWSSALNTAASAHLLANSTHGLCLDFKPHESPMQHELVDDPWIQQAGNLAMRKAPGLGVTVREQVVKKYLMQ